ncbi:MAG: hypothetical protein M3020_27205 [Myxococcota bacterium]|jgi:hypothetical protein|nr:hypothetical protein [Myxococcota bacterium]
MLPPFIIEQIRRREEERCRREAEQPRLELPLDVYHPVEPKREEREPSERGVVILDLG